MSTICTNEELTERIQRGENGLYAELWQRTRLLLLKLANRYYTRSTERFTSAGADGADVEQACFLALCDAVRMYDADKGYMLTSYFRFAVKNQMRSLLGVRTTRRDALDGCRSIDEPLTGEDDFTLCDTLPDEAAQAEFESIEQLAYNDALRDALEKALNHLPPHLATLIRLYYFEGRTLADATAAAGYSPNYGHTLHRRALLLLRRYDRGHGHGCLRAFLFDTVDDPEERRRTAAYHNTGRLAFRFGGSSVERAAEIAADGVKADTRPQHEAVNGCPAF